MRTAVITVLVGAALAFCLSNVSVTRHEGIGSQETRLQKCLGGDTSSGISASIALNNLGAAKSFQYRDIFLLLTVDNFDENSLSKTFTCIAAEYPSPEKLYITVFNDQELLRQRLAEYYDPDPDIALRRHNVSTNSDGLLSRSSAILAHYSRTNGQESFDYRSDADKNGHKRVVLRTRIIQYVGDPASDYLLAGKMGDSAKIIALTKNGASPNSRGADGETPLMKAALRCHTDAVIALIRAGANPNLKNQQRDTALTYAASSECLQVVKVLIRVGADVNAVNDFGYTGLLLACHSADTEMIEELVSAGADLGARDRRGNTALRIAMEKGLYAAAELLKKKGAKL